MLLLDDARIPEDRFPPRLEINNLLTWTLQQLNISYPANGSQKLIDIEDERKLRVFMEKRVRRTLPIMHTPPPFEATQTANDMLTCSTTDGR